MMSGIILVWAFGAFTGPTLGGVAMQLIGASGVFWVTAIALLALTAAMVLRRAEREDVDSDEKGDYAPSTPTSLSMSDISPMGDEDDATPLN
jgi:MFS family permease